MNWGTLIFTILIIIGFIFSITTLMDNECSINNVAENHVVSLFESYNFYERNEIARDFVLGGGCTHG